MLRSVKRLQALTMVHAPKLLKMRRQATVLARHRITKQQITTRSRQRVDRNQALETGS